MTRKLQIFRDSMSRNPQNRIERKENQTKYRKMARKPRSHVRILIYRTWAIWTHGWGREGLCTKFQSSLLNFYICLKGVQSSLLLIHLPVQSKYLLTPHQSVARKVSDVWRSIFEIGAARRSFAPLRKSRRNHCSSCVWTEALSSMNLVPAQKLPGIA